MSGRNCIATRAIIIIKCNYKGATCTVIAMTIDFDVINRMINHS